MAHERHARRYRTVRVRIQFREQPPIGWERDPKTRLRVFPRDESGNLFFSRRYWRGMLAEGVARFAPALFDACPTLMEEIRVCDVRRQVPALGIVRDFGEEWEQLPANFELETTISFPEGAWSVKGFAELLALCGEFIGWAPVRAADGYGCFVVKEVVPL